jgi:hypothetical protein
LEPHKVRTAGVTKPSSIFFRPALSTSPDTLGRKIDGFDEDRPRS